MRLTCSLLVLGISWALSGSVFAVLIQRSDFLRAWFIGGTIIFLMGWIIVGLPLVALGDRISSVKYFPVITIGSGLTGAFILFIPDLMARVLDQKRQYPWSLSELVWPGIGFSIAAPTALIYCILLRMSMSGERRS
jgi:hypothetical protein